MTHCNSWREECSSRSWYWNTPCDNRAWSPTVWVKGFHLYECISNPNKHEVILWHLAARSSFLIWKANTPSPPRRWSFHMDAAAGQRVISGVVFLKTKPFQNSVPRWLPAAKSSCDACRPGRRNIWWPGATGEFCQSWQRRGSSTGEWLACQCSKLPRPYELHYLHELCTVASPL